MNFHGYVEVGTVAIIHPQLKLWRNFASVAHDQPSEYRLTIYRCAIIVSFSKYRQNIDIAFFLKISHDINNEVCTVNCLQFASKIKIT